MAYNNQFRVNDSDVPLSRISQVRNHQNQIIIISGKIRSVVDIVLSQIS